jgi:ribosome maturation factor RimP
MDKEIIRKHIEPLLTNTSLKLYDVTIKSMLGSPLVEILLDSDDVAIDTEMLTFIHEKILEFPDEIISDDAMIEVSSVGAERPIVSMQDYVDAKNRYIYVVSDFYKGYGDLIDIIHEDIQLKVTEKSKISIKSIPISKISLARRAVKI